MMASNPDLLKESISTALLPYMHVFNSLRNNSWLVFIFRLGSPLFYQQCDAGDVENSKLIRHSVLQPCPFQVQSLQRL